MLKLISVTSILLNWYGISWAADQNPEQPNGFQFKIIEQVVDTTMDSMRNRVYPPYPPMHSQPMPNHPMPPFVNGPYFGPIMPPRVYFPYMPPYPPIPGMVYHMPVMYYPPYGFIPHTPYSGTNPYQSSEPNDEEDIDFAPPGLTRQPDATLSTSGGGDLSISYTSQETQGIMGGLTSSSSIPSSPVLSGINGIISPDCSTNSESTTCIFQGTESLDHEKEEKEDTAPSSVEKNSLNEPYHFPGEIEDFDLLGPFTREKITDERDPHLASFSLNHVACLINPQKKTALTKRRSIILLNEIHELFSQYINGLTIFYLDNFEEALGHIVQKKDKSIVFSEYLRDFMYHKPIFMNNLVDVINIQLGHIPGKKRFSRSFFTTYAKLLHHFYKIGFGLPPKHLRGWDEKIFLRLKDMRNEDIIDIFFSHGKMNAHMSPRFLNAWYKILTDRLKASPKGFQVDHLIRAIYAHGLLDLMPCSLWLQEIMTFVSDLKKLNFEINDGATARELLWANHFLNMKQLDCIALPISKKAIARMKATKTTESSFQTYVKKWLEEIARKSFDLYAPRVIAEEFLDRVGTRVDGVIYARKFNSFTMQGILQHVIVFEADGYPHMYGNQINTVTQFRNRIYAHLGYILIAVNYREWDLLQSNSDRKDFIITKYKESLAQANHK